LGIVSYEAGFCRTCCATFDHRAGIRYRVWGVSFKRRGSAESVARLLATMLE